MPPAIIPIALLATSAFGIGDTLYQQANAPSGSSATTGPTQAQAIAAEEANRKVATSQAQQQLPGLQSATDGSVSPGYLQDMSSLLSGNSQYGQSPQIQQAVQQFLGNYSGTIPSSTTPSVGGAGGSSGAANPLSSLFPGMATGSVNDPASGGTGTTSTSGSQPQQPTNPFAALGFGT